jgi:hypothetical protein
VNVLYIAVIVVQDKKKIFLQNKPILDTFVCFLSVKKMLMSIQFQFVVIYFFALLYAIVSNKLETFGTLKSS